MRFRFTILAFALFYTYVVSYSINVDDLPAFFDDDDDDEVSRQSWRRSWSGLERTMGTMERWIQFSKRICVTITMLFIWTTRELECIAIHRFASVRSSSLTISTETRTAVVRQVLRRKTKYVWVGDSHQVESIREKVLRFFNADPEEYTVAFTSGATGALHTIGESFPWSEKSKFYYLAEVHPCRGNHTQSHNSVDGYSRVCYSFWWWFPVS